MEILVSLDKGVVFSNYLMLGFLDIYDYLDLFTMWFRDVLLFKATKEVDGLVFKDQYNYIKERAKKSSYEGIENIIDAIGKARERLHSNVNFDLVMELLFMTIREN